MASEILLKVGKKGEIYTSKELRQQVGLKVDSKVKVTAEKGRLVIEPVPSLEDMLLNPVVKLSPSEAERISEEEQKRVGVYG